MKVTRILHHSVNVEGRLGDCEAFYRRMGLPGLARPDIPGVGGRWLAVGAAQVHLVDASHRRPGHPTDRTPRLLRGR